MGATLNWLSIGLNLIVAVLWFVSATIKTPLIGNNIDELGRVKELTEALQFQSQMSMWAAIATGCGVLAGTAARIFP